MRRRRSSTLSPKNSADSRASTSGASISYFHRPSLGDKMQRLVVIAPAYARAVELLVDLMLKRFEG